MGTALDTFKHEASLALCGRVQSILAMFKKVSGPLNWILDDTASFLYIKNDNICFVTQSKCNLDLCVCLFEIYYLSSLADLVTVNSLPTSGKLKLE